MLNETPFADARPTADGFSIPALKWRELLFTGALRAEGDGYVRDPSRPMTPFVLPDPFPIGARFHARPAGERVEVVRVDGGAPLAPAVPQAAAFDLTRLQDEQLRRARRYFEFLRVPALSAGLYRLSAGAPDPQRPHAEDEVYVVLAGRACISLGEPGRDETLGPGSLVFVPAGLPHRFHSIEEELSVLVLFAPAERAPSNG